jgi:hypothetical protein
MLVIMVLAGGAVSAWPTTAVTKVLGGGAVSAWPMSEVIIV